MNDPDLVGASEAPQKPVDLTAPDSLDQTSTALQGRRPRLWPFVFQFWRTRAALPALALLATSLCITFGSTYLMVWSNKLIGQVADALVGKKWDVLGPTLVTSVGVGITSGSIAIVNVAVIGFLGLRWRTWLSDRLLDSWTRRSAFYDIEREGLLANADQRIAEDVRLFVESSLNLFSSLVGVTSHVVTFTVILWVISRAGALDIGGSHYEIPGYMVYLAFAYAGGSLLVTHLFGKRLIALNMQRQGVEADYRYLGMQLRENAEQVAFYGGGQREHGRLLERFAYVRENLVRVIVRTFKVEFAQTAYGHLLSPLPTLAALPLYLAGTVTYGGMTRASGAFSSLIGGLSFFSQAYVGFTAWLAVANRLRDLSVALTDAHERRNGFTLSEDSQPEIRTEKLVVQTPKGDTLTVVPNLQIAAGQRWLIRGPSGTGKSTFLRVLAGIWPYGSGVVRLPRQSTTMFLPQRSYIPSGTLRAALCYPAPPEKFDEGKCAQALERCGLDHLVQSLDSIDRWQQKLSGGEQQRLAFARVFLQRPDFIFLDESTSALDPATEQRLYEALLAELPGSAVISVAHRESLARYHPIVLDLVPVAAR